MFISKECLNWHKFLLTKKIIVYDIGKEPRYKKVFLDTKYHASTKKD